MSCYYTHVQHLRYWVAILKAVSNARDTDQNSYLRHNVTIAYEMAHGMQYYKMIPKNDIVYFLSYCLVVLKPESNSRNVYLKIKREKQLS